MIIKNDKKMRKQLIMYVIIDKNTDQITINKYLNSDIPYFLGMNVRKVQRIFAEKDKIETERYTIYKVYNIDLGNRGGKRERKRSDDW
jgi:hypothetical protein